MMLATLLNSIILRTFIILFCLTSGSFVFSQDIEAKIKIVSLSPARVSIEGKFLTENLASKDVSFLRNIADVSNLGERIESFRVFNKSGTSLEVKKLIAGEFQTTEIPNSWQYEVKAEISKKLTDAAHVSWLSEDLGLLMLGDLLPRFGKPVSAKISFELPDEWRIVSSEIIGGDKTFNVKNIENAVFLIGKKWREKAIQIDKSSLSVAFAGDWKFSDDEALEMASSILTEHKSVFKEIPNQKTQIFLLPFPQENSNPDRWRAETRSATVTIISGAVPFKSQAVQRLHEQLRHEIFHLWIPNSLALSGNYDWFYEGFTIYQALRTGVELNQIRFEDFLNTLGHAYQMAQFLSSDGGQTFSLLEASDRRWAGSSNFVYAKGLVVAFLCDAALLRESKGKRNLKEVFYKIYQKHRFPNQIQDGNTAIVSILKGFPELNLVVQNYIEGKAQIDWQNDLTATGLELAGIQLKVVANPNGRQKDLLDKLGYNQWRKILQKTR